MNNLVIQTVGLRQEICSELSERNYEVLTSEKSNVMDMGEKNNPSLVVVDGDSAPSMVLELCRSVHQKYKVPILVVATAMDEIDELLAYAVGVDDCVIGPLSIRRVVAKIEALNRRSRGFENVADPLTGVLRHGELSLDVASRLVSVSGNHVSLTRTEFEILTLLMLRPHHVIKRQNIVEKVWPNWFGDERVVEVHLSRLRRKVLLAGGPRIAESVRGVGYRLGVLQPA
ncbi:response regulator transcription factor [Paeniglutamicibacter sp. Y32M11]|uniref:response regulator transcription factor n=1 Tax=Paeniglutamicibacter sp. Y32M11 TaxID=2853258 RepID=UPI001C52CC3D|nr:response regulator transcription factor [Paeniglutamicibacter sp. Y32M11]QXQ10592.1 response regulator transcription factor [Paeniglutamicibacter sp. Y32M11]